MFWGFWRWVLLEIVDWMEPLQKGNHPTTEDSQIRVPEEDECKPVECLQSAQIQVGAGEIAAAKPPDRIKRDEWSEGGVMSLLDVYEAKWMLRNRAKLKGSDWEEIAQQVSVRCSAKKSAKSPNQCKNKIESMKKRYRAESAANNSVSTSSWQFYARMDGLLKGTYCSQSKVDGCVNGVPESGLHPSSKIEIEDTQHVLQWVNDNGPAHPQNLGKNLNCEIVDVEADAHMQDSNQDDESNALPNNRKSSRGTDSDVSTPRSKIANIGEGSGKVNSFKRRKNSSSDVAESIRLLAHSLLKIEQARMEMYKNSERLRAEAEIRRSEMELKRTEIIANTQLQIAKLLARRPRTQKNDGGNSSLRAEPTVPTDTDGGSVPCKRKRTSGTVMDLSLHHLLLILPNLM
ncbi:trihelix transcription factor ASIL1-like isoform X2 [Macadamia integrifolia]|uniref:trihelix transcription factor ASIL1-like isoform X2 n=1 Tax=Macadamia integrifolia TaxID=60698 RepID=UPI001C4FD0AB|nr:trihelix transcription factor ASIL1-like isoform X2 [Macadamia integrifolia]